MKRTWYIGDTHMHTVNSDGILTKEKLIEKAKKMGLEFMIITDHNFNTLDKSYFDEDMLVIQGQELTDELGHVNIWGKKVPLEPPYDLNSSDDYKKIIDLCKKEGATVSVNHPFCSNCPFRLNLDDYPFDCVEVWNTIQHTDNVKNMNWWANQLLNGNKIGAVGGSDFHRDYATIPFLAMPTTHVLCEEKTTESILKAMRDGNCVVTNSPKSSMIYLTCDKAQVGDTVKFADNSKVKIQIDELKSNHKVLVYNNEKVIFDYTAKKSEKNFSKEIVVESKGFVRAEITHRFNPLIEKVYAFAERKFLSSRGVDGNNSGHLPDFFWAFTNPIWFE